MIIRTAFALAATGFVTTAAAAHITFAEPAGQVGSYYVGLLRVTHGCAGSATLAIRVQIPAAITAVRPQPKPGWTLTIEHAPLATPLTGEGGVTVRERVTAVTWTGRLEADQFDQFGLMLKLPEAAGALYFPTVQRCETGATAWTTIPAAGQPWHSVKTPAPVLQVTGGDPQAMPSMPM